MSGGELVRPLEERLLRRAVLEREIRPQRLGVDLAAKAGVLEEGFDLRAEQKRAVPKDRIIERLYAEIVPRAVERASLFVPDDEREHPAQAGSEAFAPLFKAVDEDLGVAAGLEDVTLRDKLVAKVDEIVDLAVENADDASILVEHRLTGALGQVDDRQPAKAEGDRRRALSGDVIAVHIGAAVDDPVRHIFENLVTVDDLARKSDKSAHIKYLSRRPATLFYNNSLYYIISRRQNKEQISKKAEKMDGGIFPRRIDFAARVCYNTEKTKEITQYEKNSKISRGPYRDPDARARRGGRSGLA